MNENLEKYNEKIQELEKRAQEYLDGWKRAKADYVNLKKEFDQKQGELMSFAIASSVLRLLPIHDNLCEAFRHVPKNLQDADWVKGIENIKRQMEEALKDFGLEKIQALGKKFDPNFHEAVAHEAQEGVEPDIILEEVKAGYTLNGKTLVPAKVKVAK